MRRHDDAGFTVVEVIVAFAIVTMVLAALYYSIGGAYRGYAQAQVREQTLALARAHLEAIGIEEPLQPAESTGMYASGVAWRLAIEPIETASQKGRAFRILLEALDHGGQPLLRLETFKLGLSTN
jgi:general secretion pathway protein I